MTKITALILMGVSGCGKTSVGVRLSEVLGWPFFDGDDFHPEENILKMSRRIPLNDDDRTPWLASLNHLIAQNIKAGRSILLGCSALKESYRTQLAKGIREIQFIYLKGDYDLILERMDTRRGHYMKADLLRSQFDVLEEPSDALIMDIKQDIDQIVQEIIGHIRSTGLD
jgi:gluconokinase